MKGTSDCKVVWSSVGKSEPFPQYPHTSGGIVRPLKKSGFDTQYQRQCAGLSQAPPGRRQESNYELFNRNNFNIRYWSWSYRGCWHQTCPPIGPR